MDEIEQCSRAELVATQILLSSAMRENAELKGLGGAGTLQFRIKFTDEVLRRASRAVVSVSRDPLNDHITLAAEVYT